MYCSFTPGDGVTRYNDRLSIYVVVEAIGIFLLFKNFNKFNLNLNFLRNPEGIFRKSVFSIAKYSYGIYLNHLIIKNVLFGYLAPVLSYEPLVLVLSVVTLLISWFIMAALNRIPYINQVIGAK